MHSLNICLSSYLSRNTSLLLLTCTNPSDYLAGWLVLSLIFHLVHVKFLIQEFLTANPFKYCKGITSQQSTF